VIEAIDEGPGIPDIELAMQPGYSTASARIREMGFGAGMGLCNIKNFSDIFQISSEVGRGTYLKMIIKTVVEPLNIFYKGGWRRGFGVNCQSLES